MKTKLRYILQLLSLVFAISIITTYCLPVTAQDNARSEKKKLLPPAEEQFQEATELVAPWRSSGCHKIPGSVQEVNCHSVTGEEWQNSDVLTLYNKDDSLWFRFSLNPKSPNNFLQNKNMEFLPFATHVDGEAVILRMVGESTNWYEVEVNEKTRATKFVLKNDPMWAKTTWSYLLAAMRLFRFEKNEQQLRDKPGGNIIKESADLRFYSFKFIKTEGDWAFVEGYKTKTYQGWIRWREGRNMLVTHPFGLLNFAKIKTDAEDK